MGSQERAAINATSHPKSMQKLVTKKIRKIIILKIEGPKFNEKKNVRNWDTKSMFEKGYLKDVRS